MICKDESLSVSKVLFITLDTQKIAPNAARACPILRLILIKSCG